MIAIVAATEMEFEPFLKAVGQDRKHLLTCLTGVGPLETAVRVGRFVHENRDDIDVLIQFGVGGSYLWPKAEQTAELLSVCLAEREILGDFGIAFTDRMEYFPHHLCDTPIFELDSQLRRRASEVLEQAGINHYQGNFITVNSVSGTARRGEHLRSRWDGLCENMEGAAAARLCHESGIPMLELRVISNMVEDRNISNWKLGEACELAGKVTALLIKELV